MIKRRDPHGVQSTRFFDLIELRRAGRAMRRTPGFSAGVALTLAIGLGAMACIFAIVNAVLLRPLPYVAPDRLVVVQHALPGLKMAPVGRLTSGMFFTYARLATLLDGIAAYQTLSLNIGDHRSGASPERARAGRVTANMFALLGVSPVVGRVFDGTDAGPKGPAVAVISEQLRRRLFGADQTPLGRTLTIDGTDHTIVGVMPEGFRFAEARTDVWLPLRLDSLSQFSGGFDQQAIARLRPGVELVSAERELQRLLPRVAESYPLLAPGLPTAAMHQQAQPTVRLVALHDALVGDFARVLWIVAGAVGVILLAAWVNVTTLFLVRFDAQQRELAIRAAVGAARSRLFGHFLVEMGVLCVVGATVGLAGAVGGVRFTTRLAPGEFFRGPDVRVGLETVLFTIVLAAIIAVACAVIGVLRFGQSDLGTVLNDASRGTASSARQRLRTILVAAQVALAVVLLASSSVLARSFLHARAIRPGFNPNETMVLWLSVPETQYRTKQDVATFYRRITDTLASVPGVVAVGAATKLPLDNDGLALAPVWPETGPLAKAQLPPLSLLTTADAGYFRALRIPLLAGRLLSPNADSAFREVMVNASMASALWSDRTGQTVVGKRLRLRPGGGTTDVVYSVVGVVSDVRDTSLLVPPPNVVYTAMSDGGANSSGSVPRTMGIVIRTRANPLASAEAFREVVHRLDSTVPMYKVGALQDSVDRSIARLTFMVVVLGAGALVTVVLCVIGLYTVISYVVRLRTREIGIRIALGARPNRIEALVVGKAVALAVIGTAVGLTVYVFSSRLLRALLVGVAAADATTLTLVSIGITALAIAASAIPARRARTIDPVDAMR